MNAIKETTFEKAYRILKKYCKWVKPDQYEEGKLMYGRINKAVMIYVGGVFLNKDSNGKATMNNPLIEYIHLYIAHDQDIKEYGNVSKFKCIEVENFEDAFDMANKYRNHSSILKGF